MNDERPIEKLLRRAAKKRRDESGPPPELHPANRRLLQDEVARQFPKPAASIQSALTEWWALLKRYWVYGIGVLAAVWIIALVIAPLLSKPNSKEMLAQNTAREISELLAARKNTSALPPPVVANSALEASDQTAPGHSESPKQTPLAEPAVMVAPVVTTAPLPKTRDRDAFINREVRNDAVALNDLAAGNDHNQPANRSESKTKAPATTVTADALYQQAPTRVAQRAQPYGNSARLGSGTPTKAAATPKPSGIKPQSEAYAASIVMKKEFDASAISSIAADSITVPAEATVETGMDKSWLARGGGAERTPTKHSSQAYSNLAAEKLARNKDTDSFRVSPKVLVNFRVEQAGRDLRVVDGDGSVYTGVVDEENTFYKQQMSRQNLNLSNTYQQQFRFQTPKLITAPATAKAAGENYYFYRVEGTNRTLNQNVVFTWNFIDTNALASGNLNFNTAGQKLDATKQLAQFPELLQKSLINGRAQFGPGREVEVNALPTAR